MQSTCAAKMMEWAEEHRDHATALEEANRLLNSRIFWDQIAAVLALLDPIAKVVLEIQSDSFPMSKVYGMLKDIEDAVVRVVPATPVSRRTEDDIRTKVLGRIKKCRFDVHLLACLLDPVTRGSRLSKEDDAKAQEMFVKIVESHPTLSVHKEVCR